MTKYYVLSRCYVGPNQHDINDVENILDGHYYYISTEPGRKNMSREVAITGWLGTTSDISKTAHGEFETIESAQAKISSEIGLPISKIRTKEQPHPFAIRVYFTTDTVRNKP